MSTAGGNKKGGGGDGRSKNGAPTKTQVDQFYDLMDAAQESGPMMTDLDLTGKDFNEFVAKNQGKFPVRPLPKDPYDTMWKIKEDLVSSNYVTEARPLPVTEQDVNYLKAKAAAEDYASYLTWEANKYDLSDPATREWFHKVCPSYFEQREKLIDDMIDLQAKYAKIRLRGPRSEDELKLEFLIEKGDIVLPTAPVWDPLSMYTADPEVIKAGDTSSGGSWDKQKETIVAKNKKVYQAGLFSPLVPMSIDPQSNKDTNHQQPMAPNPFNRGDVRGDPNKRFVGIPGALPPRYSDYAGYMKPQLGLYARDTAFIANTKDYKTNVEASWINMITPNNYAKLGSAQKPPDIA